MNSNNKLDVIGVYYHPEKGRFSFNAPEEIQLGFFETEKLVQDMANEITAVVNRYLPTESVENFPATNSAKKGRLYVKPAYLNSGCCGYTNYTPYIDMKPNKVPKITAAKVDEILLNEMDAYRSRCRF